MTDPAADATGLARWLLLEADSGTSLTATFALSRATVRAAVATFPALYDVEPFGPPFREADVPELAELREGLVRLRLLRRRARALVATSHGRELRGDPARLLGALVEDARVAAGDAFCAFATRTTVDGLRRNGPATFAVLEAHLDQRLRAEGWRDVDGGPPPREDVVDVLQEVRARLGAYGLLEEHGRSSREWRLALTAAGRACDWEDGAASTAPPSRRDPSSSPSIRETRLPPLVTDDAVLVIEATLENAPGVAATLAVRADDTFEGLHDAIQQAFGWLDDHLYAFWLDGRWFSSRAVEITTPETPDEGGRSAADLRLGDVGLRRGHPVAYAFDFGHEWRVRLCVRERTTADGGTYPRVLERVGEAPPQH